MAFDARHDLPTYTLAELPPDARHVVLTPAVRWRVIVEVVRKIEHDVILDAVLRIWAAGETSPTRIADFLQLPEDLVRHLLAQAAMTRMRVTQGGQLEASSSEVAWVYRDVATGELWPHPAKEVPPLPLRFKSTYRAEFDRGTAGRPIRVECLLLGTKEATAADPTSVELARFSRTTGDVNQRTALVSSGERCMVASPVLGLADGYAIATTRGVPHLSLTQLLGELMREKESARRWLANVPRSPVSPDESLPLCQAADELRDLAAGHQTPGPAIFLSHIELCLSRFVDQFQYLYGVRPREILDIAAATATSERAGLSHELARAMAQSHRGTVGQKLLRLLLAEPDSGQPFLRDLVEAVTDLAVVSAKPEMSSAMERLVDKTIELCDRLLIASEGADVEQAG